MELFWLSSHDLNGHFTGSRSLRGMALLEIILLDHQWVSDSGRQALPCLEDIHQTVPYAEDFHL
jgi:hypothetical protein